MQKKNQKMQNEHIIGSKVSAIEAAKGDRHTVLNKYSPNNTGASNLFSPSKTQPIIIKATSKEK